MSAKSHRSPSAELLLRGSHQRQEANATAAMGSPGGGERTDDDVDLEQLQQQAVGKSEETTSAIRNCIRVAEDMKQQAGQTMVQLHEQGQQIRRTHDSAIVLEQELNKGEKLLASLGGIFSRPWRPKRGHELVGPMDFHHDAEAHAAAAHPARTELLLHEDHQVSSNSSSPPRHASTFQAHVQEQREKQDEAFSDLSSVLDQLKDMSVAMGTELQSQNQSLGRLHDDVTELEFRVKNANAREQQLLHR